MQIVLEQIGRRFNKEWIFKSLTFTFETDKQYAILGPNGSGKSTLLNVILGNLSPSEGKLNYLVNNKTIEVESIYKYISLAAPYLDLVEEFTLLETINFHFKFKAFSDGLDTNAVLDLLALPKAKDKPLKYFSSGMKQRTKLALALCADTPILALDEPTSNLDTQGIEWYQNLISQLTKNRLLLVGSNQEHEYSFCKEQIKITDYK